MQQIMDLLYKEGELTAAQLEGLLPGKPNNSTVRSHLRVLEERGLIAHRQEEESSFSAQPTPGRKRQEAQFSSFWTRSSRVRQKRRWPPCSIHVI